jgi:hypothetical protein
VGGRKSSGCHRGRFRRPERHSGGGDENTHAHSTLSAETTHAHVFYRFHPLYGSTLQIVRRPKRGDGAVSVIDQTGRRLKIPVWMLSPEAAETVISEQIHLSKEALLSLASLLSLHTSKSHGHDNLLLAAVDECKGGHREATGTIGPGDSGRKRNRARRCDGTCRSG